MQKALLVILLMSIQSCKSDFENKIKEKFASNKVIDLEMEFNDKVLSENNIVDVSQFQRLEEGLFAILDKFVTKQAFIFDANGRLQLKLGGPGEGPGEYRAPTGLAQIGNRWYLSEVGGKLNVYSSEDGRYLAQYFLKGNPAIAKGLYALDEHRLLLPIFSKYAEYSLYILDLEGNSMAQFSKPDKEFGKGYDSFAPQGGVVIYQNAIYQFFNHRYEILVWSFEGSLQKTIPLASGLYQAPDSSKMGNFGDSNQRKLFRSTYTQMVGLFRLNSGWVTVLRNWKDLNSPVDTLEYWDSDWLGKGRTEISPEKELIGSDGDQLMFLKVSDQHTEVIYKQPAVEVWQ